MKAFAGRVVILVENCSYPSDERVRLVAETLMDGGYRVSVICPKGGGYATRSHEVLNDVSVYRYGAWECGSSFLSYLVEYSRATVAMMFLCAVVYFREGFDVMHLCSPPDSLFLVALPYKLLGKKVIFDHHDLSPELYTAKTKDRRNGIVHKLLLWLEKLAFKTADVVISTNESYKGIAISRGKVQTSHIFVVRNGPDLSRLRKVTPNPGLKNGKSHLLFYVGVMGEQDGVDYLLRSVHFLHHTCKQCDFHVILMGTGSELDKLKLYAHELQIDDMVTFTGRVPDSTFVETLSTADVCLCPDPKNPLNDVSTMIKTLEYMAVGKPIVAYDLMETRISAGDAALYATPNDERSFAEKIAALLDSPEIRQELGRIGEDRIRNSLSWEYSKDSLYAAYSKALEK